MDRQKITAIQAFPVPENVKELQRFLVMAARHQCFVLGVSQLTEPLNALKLKQANSTGLPSVSMPLLPFIINLSPNFGTS